MLDILGVVAFAVLFAVWWAFKPLWSRTARSADAPVPFDPLVGATATAATAAATRSTAAATASRSTTGTVTRTASRPSASHSPASPSRGRARPADIGAAPSGFRPDIEGLRAIAVLLVLGFHIGEVRYGADRIGANRPWFFDGGFIGVDVFFVLSGFLITSLLLRELASTGTISLSRFWSRRVRRLLAASSLVIVSTLVASRWMLEPLRQDDLAHDAIAAALFVSNIAFGRRGNDYLTSQLAPSPLLHFWSLSLEEQFYVVWPGLLLLVARGRNLRHAAGATVAVFGLASFVACLWFTNRSPVWAFYLLPTRAWELLIGAGLAVAGVKLLRISPQVRAIAAWAGLGAIVVAAVAYSTSTKFPGIAALVPVLGAAAVVGAGGLAGAGSPTAILSVRPLQWIGKRSYAIYLWHWPALILFDAAYGPLGLWQLVAVVIFAIGLSALSFHFVEDPVRRSGTLASPARGLTFGAVLVAASVACAAFVLANPQSLSGGGTASAPTLPGVNADPSLTTPGGTESDTSDGTTDTTDPDTTDSTDPSATAAPPPIGSLDDLEAAAGPALEEAALTTAVPDNLRPSLRDVRGDLPAIYDDGCLLPESGRITSGDCVYGDPNSDTTVVLAGDSHAAQWFPSVHEAAKRRGWRLVVQAKRGCPAADFPTYGSGNRERTECGPWREKVAERLAQEQPDLLIVASYRYRLTNENAAADSDDVWRAALTDTLGAWRPLAGEMLVLSDTPNPVDDIPTCLSANLRDVTDCVRPRTKADKADLLAAERAATEASGGTLATTSNWLCGDTTCPVILGDLLLYRDDNHITATAAEYLTPFLEAAAAPLLGR